MRRSSLGVAIGVAALCLLTALGPARADEEPTPAETTLEVSTSATEVSPEPELSPLGVPVVQAPTTPDEESQVAHEKEKVQKHSDALPPSKGVSDEYLARWERLQALQIRVARLRERERESLSNERVADTRLQDATTAFDAATVELEAAKAQLNLAVRSMYINQTSQVDAIIRALGNSPEDVLNSLDNALYIDAIGNARAVEFEVVLANFSSARAAVLIATTDQEVARGARIDAERNRKVAEVVHAQAETAFAAMMTRGGPQTQVDGSGCPKGSPPGTSPVDVQALCKRAVKQAATPQAASALKWALTRLGAPYACGGVGRMDPFRFDCSSYVSRAYADGAGLNTAGETWAPSTRNMVPWDGATLDRHYAPIVASQLRPGDLVLYDTCPSNTCGYKHVVMYLGSGLMAHTNACGGVAHIEQFWGTGHNLLGARRVLALAGERVKRG